MPDKPKVTVLIATYNKAEALRYAISSVLWQTFEEFELMVIGDGCTDHSQLVVESFDDPRIYWHNLPENTGYQSEPHNEGLRLANGEFIAYLNHDDLWLPNHLQTLVDRIEETGADFAYSILEWILSYGENYADIPIYPDAPRPPEASATLHRRSIVDEIGWWKPPEATKSVPRAEFFRRAQFSGMRFEIAPMLTVLKFGGNAAGYAAVSHQPEYFERVSSDPQFVIEELSRLLVGSHRQGERPTTPRHYLLQVGEYFRRKLVARRIEPSQLLFWHKPGWHIRTWRKAHRLPPARSGTSSPTS